MMTRVFSLRYKYVLALIYTLIFSVLLMSCETTKTKKFEPEALTDPNSQITDATHIVMKDGSFILIKEKEVFIKNKYKDSVNVLVIRDTKGIPVRDSIKNITKLYYPETLIPVANIKEIYVQKTEFNAEGTVFSVLGILAGAALIFVLAVGISLSNHPPRSCPYIYSFDGTKYVLDAEPLGGAVCEGLERTDISRLENLKSVDGKFKILVKNVNDEQQRIDEMMFINVKHSPGETVTPDFNKKIFKYTKTIEPLSVINEDGTDITKFFLHKDNAKWLNELPIDSTQKSPNPKENLTLKFPKPKNAKNAMLMINGGASYFGSNIIKEVLDLKGNKVDEWYKSIYPGSDEQKKLFSTMHRDETYYMDIKVSEGGSLRKAGIMRSNGPMIDEDVLYPISFDDNNSDVVEIVLTPQRHFWKFDQISMIYDYEEVNPSDIETLKMSYAKDNNGNDVISRLSSTDKSYYNMPNIGDKTNIYIDVPSGFNTSTNDIFVATTGWYDINLEKNTEPNEQMVENIYNNENALYDYALNLYFKLFKDITQTLNLKRINEN